MRKSRSGIVMLLIVISFVSLYATTHTINLGYGLAQAAHTAGVADIQVTLSAAYSTISWDVRDPEQARFELPVLYLQREREYAGNTERTLEIFITGIKGGDEINLEITSRHVNISTGKQYTKAQSFNLPDRHCSADDPCAIQWTFNPQTTLSDFYRLRVRNKAGDILWQNSYDDRPDFVMLDTWDVGLSDYTVRVIYATLFPFDKGRDDSASRLAPDAVKDFVEQQFVPIIIETWYTQFITWGLGKPIHPAWDADNIMEIIITDTPITLFGGMGISSQFITKDNQPTPECRLWWASSSNTFQAYDTLTDATKAVYAHEFFHLVQRNILLYTDYPNQRWMNIFIEAQGKFAPSVQYPNIEVRRYGVRSMHYSEYLDAANRFLTQRLNTSYTNMEADPIHRYDYALYWRFLFEQYGDMKIIQTALIEMTNQYHPDIVPAIEKTINRSFKQIVGPFESFKDSLIAFARANYALRLRDGRCKVTDYTECDGFYYDPSGTYAEPPLEAELTFVGFPLSYEGAIPVSYGMDFIEIILEKGTRQQPVILSLEGDSIITQFNVQIWKVMRACSKQYAITDDLEIITQQPNGIHVHMLPSQDKLEYDKLVLIITRLDAQEQADPKGVYTVRVVEGNDK